jgi:hypothetical protein
METIRLIVGIAALVLTAVSVTMNENRLVPICIALWAAAVGPGIA